MSVWLTPALQPFYGGTYFPPTSRWGRPGLRRDPRRAGARVARGPRHASSRRPSTILERLRSFGQSAGGGRRARARRARPRGGRVRGGVRSRAAAASATRPSSRARASCCSCCASTPAPARADAARHDAAHAAGDGAWRHARPHRRRLPPLLRGRRLARAALREDALRPGAAGAAYLEAAQATGDAALRRRGRRHARYVRRDLTHPEGGFYSAEDADSVPPEHAGDAAPHKMEGAFYIWTDAELRRRLGDRRRGRSASASA